MRYLRKKFGLKKGKMQKKKTGKLEFVEKNILDIFFAVKFLAEHVPVIRKNSKNHRKSK